MTTDDFKNFDWQSVALNQDQKLLGYLHACTLFAAEPLPWMLPVVSDLCGDGKKVEQMLAYLHGNRKYAQLPIYAEGELSNIVQSMVTLDPITWKQTIADHKVLPHVGRLLAYFFRTAEDAENALLTSEFGMQLSKIWLVPSVNPTSTQNFQLRLCTGSVLSYHLGDKMHLVGQVPLRMLTAEPSSFLAFRQWLHEDLDVNGPKVNATFDYLAWKTLQSLSPKGATPVYKKVPIVPPAVATAPTVDWSGTYAGAPHVPQPGDPVVPPKKKPFVGGIKLKKDHLVPTGAALNLGALPAETLPEPTLSDEIKTALSESQQQVVLSTLTVMRSYIQQVVTLQLKNVVSQVVVQMVATNPQLLNNLIISLTPEQLKELIDVDNLVAVTQQTVQHKVNHALQHLDGAKITEDLRQQVMKQINPAKLQSELIKTLSATGEDYFISIFPRVIVTGPDGTELGTLSLKGQATGLPLSTTLKQAAALVAEKPISKESPLKGKLAEYDDDNL